MGNVVMMAPGRQRHEYPMREGLILRSDRLVASRRMTIQTRLHGSKRGAAPRSSPWGARRRSAA